MKVSGPKMPGTEPAIRIQDCFKTFHATMLSDPSAMHKLSTSFANNILTVLTCSQMQIVCEHTLW